ncbi:N-acetylglucosamine-1-phosphotransferase subunits alpha/beta-like [Mercenaria mercenaria]|uniref:N-acetylglucosamine-1-phosphotransferase subunits alpha/beta-like n=1 Tax=Mercenaria mercenaria TaxID=6596 RepID=UPI00234F9353|nr:N-acetylglucosamine-1-phosphotransferase subunits alpha/beta-like [Mercenaria mercenaria]
MSLRRLCGRRRRCLYLGLFFVAVFPFLFLRSGDTVQNVTSVPKMEETMPQQNLDIFSIQTRNVSMVEPKETAYKESIDLVYLWANGTDPRFILDLKRQKALEDAEKYHSSLSCKRGSKYGEHIHVVVVYPALPRTKKLSENDNIRFIFNVSENDMNYSVIIPIQKQTVSGIMSTLTEIEGQTYISVCGYITNEHKIQAKKTLENMYLVNSKNSQSINNITRNMEGVGIILQDDVNIVTDAYALVYSKPSETGNIFTKNIEKLERSGFEIKHAVLVWDTDNIEIEGVPRENAFADNEQLMYSIRSVEKYAPWIQHIYIITNDQVPSWLNVSNKRVSVVYTKEIFPNKNDLPTFSSPAIESYMHRIPGLSDTFLFMCDDFFLGQPVHLSDFYTAEEGLRIDWDGRIADCSSSCANRDVGNGKCDPACDNLKCGWDHGDCRSITREHTIKGHPLGHHYGSTFHTMGMFNKRRSGFNQSIIYQMPPHAPLLVNKSVAIDLAKTFQEDFEKSSAFHFRTQFNIQYTMAYLHFVSSALEVMTPEQIFDEVDEDKSGVLSVKELWNLGNMIFGSNSEDQTVNLINTTINCMANLNYDFGGNKGIKENNRFQISKSMFTRCSGITDILTRVNVTHPKYKHMLVAANNSHFVVVHKLKFSKRDLSNVLMDPRKFNAVNDNMDHSTPESGEIKKLLKNFYQTLFPTPSQFELRIVR